MVVSPFGILSLYFLWVVFLFHTSFCQQKEVWAGGRFIGDKHRPYLKQKIVFQTFMDDPLIPEIIALLQ